MNGNDSVISTFDRMVGSLTGLPDVLHTKPTTITTVLPIVGLAQAFIVQTFRHKEQGDWIFIQSVSAEGTIRMVLHPKVSRAIKRQEGALTDMSRSKAAKTLAADRKQRGEKPGFMKNRKEDTSRG